MSTKESIYKQHEENTEWTNKLNFYGEEISILSGRLAEITSKNSNKEMLSEVEHFQNQFIIQRNNIDEIKHGIKMNEESIQREINNNPTAADHRKTEYHVKEKDLVATFETNFNELKNSFNRFASKWM